MSPRSVLYVDAQGNGAEDDDDYPDDDEIAPDDEYGPGYVPPQGAALVSRTCSGRGSVFS